MRPISALRGRVKGSKRRHLSPRLRACIRQGGWREVIPCVLICTPPPPTHSQNEAINVIMEEVGVTVTLEEGEWTERVLGERPGGWRWKLGQTDARSLYLVNVHLAAYPFFYCTPGLPPAWKETIPRPPPPTSHYKGLAGLSPGCSTFIPRHVPDSSVEVGVVGGRTQAMRELGQCGEDGASVPGQALVLLIGGDTL